MEIGIEYDPNFGQISESDSDLAEIWRLAAEKNVNEKFGSQEKENMIQNFKDKLDQKGIVLEPGDRHQLVEILRFHSRILNNSIFTCKSHNFGEMLQFSTNYSMQFLTYFYHFYVKIAI